MKKISVCIITFNSEKTLLQCIASIHLQTIRPFEIFVVDQGSTDATLHLLKQRRIRVIKNDENNLAKARNIALRAARTNYLLFIDHDICLEPEWIRHAVPCLTSRIIAVGGIVIESDSSSYGRWAKIHLSQQSARKEYIAGSNFLCITKKILSLGGFNTKYKTNYEDVTISKLIKEQGYRFVTSKKSISHHLKTYTFTTLYEIHWKYTFYDWPEPNTFRNLLTKLFVNMYITLKYCFRDKSIFWLNLPLFFMQSKHDLHYFLKYGR